VGIVPILFGLETRIHFSRRGTALLCPYKSIFRNVIEPAILNRTVLGIVLEASRVLLAGLDERCPPTRVSAGGHFLAVVFILKKESLGGNAHPTNLI